MEHFFKSVIGTLNHILVGDIIWLKRFSSHSSSQYLLSYFSILDWPESLNSVLFTEFTNLRNEREIIDGIIIRWINSLSECDIDSSLSYYDMKGVQFNKPFSSLISHLFLHQVHHRGQVTTLLSQLGVDFGDTDLIEIIDEI
ncbi:MAG: DinB family protein [Sedimenticola sp.]